MAGEGGEGATAEGAAARGTAQEARGAARQSRETAIRLGREAETETGEE